MNNKDIFLCHASEDKESVVRPLARLLESNGISCWLDEAEIGWGDSIPQNINRGLTGARFVIVVLSAHSINKNWTQRELSSALNIEAGQGQVKVLPLLVGDSEQHGQILEQLPLLNDKKYLVWDGNGQDIIQALESVLGRPSQGKGDPFNAAVSFDIPMPKIKKKFTDFDRDKFLRESFDTIAAYFQKALNQLEHNVQEIDTDFDKIQRYKFVAKIFINGKEESRCKIWRGGVSDGIAYSESFHSYEGDNGFNEQLSVEYKDPEPGLRFLMGSAWGTGAGDEDQILSSVKAAQGLWERFIQRIEDR